jgi:hypothetical protein
MKTKETESKQKKGGKTTGLHTSLRTSFWKDEIEEFCREKIRDCLLNGENIPQAQQLAEMFRNQDIFFNQDEEKIEFPLKSKTILNHIRHREWKAQVLAEYGDLNSGATPTKTPSS